MFSLTAAIVAAFAFIYLPRFVAIAGQLRMPGGFSYGASRDQQTQLSGIWRRAQAAHINGVEGFGPFAAAVLLLMVLGAPSDTAQQLAWGYVASRAAFVISYLADLNPWRTLVWIAGLGCNVGLFVLALQV